MFSQRYCNTDYYLFVKDLISSFTVLSFVRFHPFSHPMIQGSPPQKKIKTKKTKQQTPALLEL